MQTIRDSQSLVPSHQPFDLQTFNSNWSHILPFKPELKTLVSLHQANGPTDVEALTEDEVTIIGAVLDLRDKPISVVMTPMEDVFTLSTDHVLDERTVDVV
ncbi:hypothetical protein BC936DRAFT_141131, partial [Jimgerdemannia flammicorona]